MRVELQANWNNSKLLGLAPLDSIERLRWNRRAIGRTE